MHDNRPAHKVMLVLVLFYAIPVTKVWSQTLKHGACRFPVCNGEGRVRPADPKEFVDGDASGQYSKPRTNFNAVVYLHYIYGNSPCSMQQITAKHIQKSMVRRRLGDAGPGGRGKAARPPWMFEAFLTAA